MPPKYKLTYFDTYGLGESIRYLLSYGGLEFEDHRVTFFESWPAAKAGTPFGVVPTLEIDGKIYHQSGAICRYVAETLKIAGSNPLENLEINQVVDVLRDIRQKIFEYRCAINKPIEEQAKIKENILKIHFPFYFNRLEKIAQENNGHMALKKFTWADINFLAFIDFAKLYFGEKILEKYPTLTKITKDVESIPKIKSYIDKRKP